MTHPIPLAAAYLRLSREEERDGESASITNQRAIIQAYCRDHALTLVEEFVDDGYSGGNFQRPDFLRLLKRIEAGKINTVITKDLSRLGRDMRESSYYAEEWFPEHGIRYIALADQFDSAAENIMAPLQFAINEMYLRDGSRKVKDVLNRKKKDGQYAACPPYGYRKDPADKSRLAPDPHTAPTVTRIFQMAAAGASSHAIAEQLTGEGILPPLKYRVLHRDDFGPRGAARASDDWNHTTVKRILKNRTYLGHTLLRRSQKVSVKSKKKVLLPEDEWYITQNTHLPLVDQETFDAAQRNLGRLTSDYTKHPQCRQSMFRRIAFCAKCGAAMCSSGTVYKGEREKYWYLACNNITEKGVRHCDGVRIKYADLLEVVRRELNQLIALDEADIAALTQRAIRAAGAVAAGRDPQAQRESAQERLEQIDKIIGKLYQDNAAGKLDDSRLDRMVAQLEQESRNLQATVAALAETEHTADTIQEDYQRFFSLAKGFAQVETLDQETIATFIARIEVGEKILPPGVTIAGPKTPYRQSLRIFYRFIGELPEDPVVEVPRAANS